jgi:hypothetical protein
MKHNTCPLCSQKLWPLDNREGKSNTYKHFPFLSKRFHWSARRSYLESHALPLQHCTGQCFSLLFPYFENKKYSLAIIILSIYLCIPPTQPLKPSTFVCCITALDSSPRHIFWIPLMNVDIHILLSSLGNDCRNATSSGNKRNNRRRRFHCGPYRI